MFQSVFSFCFRSLITMSLIFLYIFTRFVNRCNIESQGMFVDIVIFNSFHKTEHFRLLLQCKYWIIELHVLFLWNTCDFFVKIWNYVYKKLILSRRATPDWIMRRVKMYLHYVFNKFSGLQNFVKLILYTVKVMLSRDRRWLYQGWLSLS
jgi:hypothetical protein